jgi:hypothetical protein
MRKGILLLVSAFKDASGKISTSNDHNSFDKPDVVWVKDFNDAKSTTLTPMIRIGHWFSIY